ncbi:MAG TPA: nuclear transport factor 2 family protein [Bacteroidota bacterium]
MRTLAGAILVLSACAGLTFAQSQTPSTEGSGKGSSPAEAVKQLEHDWVDAAKAGDVDKLGAVLADDWVGLGFGPEKSTKKSYLAETKAGDHKLQSFDFGPMDVKVMGTIAVVQGSDTEKSSYKDKDTSGKYQWMDVFVKRNGKWVVVRSQNAMVQ